MKVLVLPEQHRHIFSHTPALALYAVVLPLSLPIHTCEYFIYLIYL